MGPEQWELHQASGQEDSKAEDVEQPQIILYDKYRFQYKSQQIFVSWNSVRGS